MKNRAQVLTCCVLVLSLAGILLTSPRWIKSIKSHCALIMSGIENDGTVLVSSEGIMNSDNSSPDADVFCSDVAESWMPTINSVVHGPTLGWRNFNVHTGVLSEITKQTYEAQYDATKYDDTMTPGWEFLTSRNHSLGMAAFREIKNNKQNSPGRLIIGFRGTTTPLDNCADWNLFAFWTPVPEACKELDASLFLHYPDTAAAFTDHILEAYCPDCDVLYTGHSLGAGMAELEALRSNGARPSVAFSSPGMKHYVDASVEKQALRRGNSQEKKKNHCALQIANPYDPVVHLTAVNQTSVLCEFQHAYEPVVCKDCYNAPPGTQAKDPECVSCFQATHMYWHYLAYLSHPPVPLCRVV